jgi:hypothetical protein
VDANGFEKLINGLRAFTPRAEVVLEEVPAPQKLATYAFAFSVDVSNGKLGDEENELASGRFVLLHEPGGQESWEGEFRCVTFLRADLDQAMEQDPMLPEFGWSWFLTAMEIAECEIAAVSGTVTRVSSASFGKLSPRTNGSEMEIRASWTPITKEPAEIINHIAAWCTLICEVAGLLETPAGVSTISPQRSR